MPDDESVAFLNLPKRKVAAARADRTDQSTPSVGESNAWPELAGYEILKEFGRGAVGVVYRARHCCLDRLVAF